MRKLLESAARGPTVPNCSPDSVRNTRRHELRKAREEPGATIGSMALDARQLPPDQLFPNPADLIRLIMAGERHSSARLEFRLDVADASGPVVRVYVLPTCVPEHDGAIETTAVKFGRVAEESGDRTFSVPRLPLHNAIQMCSG